MSSEIKYFTMKYSILIFFLPLLLPTLAILRPNSDPVQNPDSDRRQGQGNSRPFVPPPPASPASSKNTNPKQQQPSFLSRELLPPQISSGGPLAHFPSNDLSPSPSFQQSQSPEKYELLPPLEIPPAFPIDSLPPQQPSKNGPKSNGDRGNAGKLELLPPIEIPPEFPIDNDPVQSSENNHQRPIIFESNSGNQFIPSRPFPGPQQQSQSRPPSSLLPTTGSGSGGPISNPNVRDIFPKQNPAQEQRQVFSQNVAAQQQVTPDPGLNCLGTCDCPPEFSFVCGSNRFLYQNDCALECDKKCNPGLVKVSMDQCS